MAGPTRPREAISANTKSGSIGPSSGTTWAVSPNKDLTFTIGRFDNPFFHTSIIWADEVGFDGAAIQGKYEVVKGLTPFFAGGAFPVFNTDLNFSTDQSAKFSSEDKYLFAVQGGTTWAINDDFTLKGAGAYYDFENIQGKVSDPILDSAQNAGNTDDSRPSFAQNGNTYIALRDYEDPTAIPGSRSRTSIIGLATPFHVARRHGPARLFALRSLPHLAHRRIHQEHRLRQKRHHQQWSCVESGAAEQYPTAGDPNSFIGGDIGYMVRLELGKVALEKLWDWNVNLTYRYVESDAVVDGFTDSDFGGQL